MNKNFINKKKININFNFSNLPESIKANFQSEKE